jgi:hypothetical protein
MPEASTQVWGQSSMAVLLSEVLVRGTGCHLCLASLVSSWAVTLMLEKDPAPGNSSRNGRSRRIQQAWVEYNNACVHTQCYDKYLDVRAATQQPHSSQTTNGAVLPALPERCPLCLMLPMVCRSRQRRPLPTTYLWSG